MLTVQEDKQEKIGHTVVQHGKLNDRIYVQDYKYALDPYLINQIQLMAKDFEYGKIIAKVPKVAKIKFERQDYEIEAKIPKFYNGKATCFFMAKYKDESRGESTDKNKIHKILENLETQSGNKVSSLNKEYSIRVLLPEDAEAIANIYKEVFKTYPFPKHDIRYIEKSMLEDIVYFGVFHKGTLIGVSSSDVNIADENVEMTDFAILPKYRGKQLATHLLEKMEKAMKDIGIKTAFTIARSISIPMNVIFEKEDYKFGGTLWNNTRISEKIESMNVWYKPLT